MPKVKTIGVLTSGGDAPGMNAAIRAVVRTARFNKINVKGVMKGYCGLMNNETINMTLRSVSGTLQRGGTILHSARCPEFIEDAGVEKGMRACQEMGIDGLVVCGGDGSFRGARDLSLKGIPCIGIPCTIDNDIASTDYTIGFDTAVNTVAENVDKLRDTSESHNRCTVVEVMGRNCGDIALNTAISCGAECVLIPEMKYDIEKDVVGLVQQAMDIGKTHYIVIVAEGVTKNNFGTEHFMDVFDLAKYIQLRTGVETRATVIGHVQRGGSPVPRDRVIASMMGNYAVQLLMSGASNRVVALKNNEIVDYDIYEALQMQQEMNKDLYRIFTEVS